MGGGLGFAFDVLTERDRGGLFDESVGGTSDVGVIALPVGLIGLFHWGAKCMDICTAKSAKAESIQRDGRFKDNQGC